MLDGAVLRAIGKKVKTTPEQEQIIFSKIACTILKRENLVKGTEPLAHTIKTQTIKMERKTITVKLLH